MNSFLVLRYFFTNKKDQSENHIFWKQPPLQPSIADVKQKLLELSVINANCHLRFKEIIDGQSIWLDISNEEVSCPISKKGIVEIKIVEQFFVGSECFLKDLFGGMEINQSSYKKLLKSLRNKLLEDSDLGEWKSPEERSEKEDQQFEIFNQDKFDEFDKEEPEDHFQEESEPVARNGGYMAFKNFDQEDLEEDINEDVDKFDINFYDSQVRSERTNEIDFINGEGYTPHKTDQKDDLGELAGLMDIGMSNEPINTQPKGDDILNMDVDFGKGPKKPKRANKTFPESKNKPHPNINSEHGRQIEEKEMKLMYANKIDPEVANWAKDPSSGREKDMRSLLITLKDLMKKYDLSFDNIMFSQVMSKSSVKKIYFKLLRKIHPDKTDEKDPKILYLYERVTEVLTRAFRKHKSMS